MTGQTTCPHCGSILDPTRDRDPRAPEGREDRLPAGPPAPGSFPPPDGGEPGGASVGASVALLGIDLERPTTSARPIEGRPRGGDVAAGRPLPDDEDDEPGEHGSAWPVALLAGYASAMTLACAWLWWTGHRGGDESPRPPRSAAPAAPEAPVEGPGPLAGESGLVEPPESVAEGCRVGLGDTLRLDALELTPLGVSVGRVELQRTRVDGRAERRPGGDRAMHLRVRLRNASDSLVFAPIDASLVREPDRRLPETFVEDASGGRVYAYRLPVSSEWGILGQEFRDLRPGEVLETTIVSDTDAPSRLDGPLTWRLRVRIDPETTAVVGVSFEAPRAEPKRGSDRDE
ncbi:hypothetical protein [Tautonia plasticadhaerens]|uniref:Uncharacterized protein n=1 Tax=Tautonia plasticadhaerens TaxID=2527974 RepID=A0A518H5K2_9BACT|nr:hypothetical protein [Tautonia plasticadhaerens]QDV36110.1 hypothetical protein ElP_40220 [Tautonia plasticadhaerens]